ncbi:MAG: TonB-dependent receptor [Pseudomonadota bacterium]
MRIFSKQQVFKAVLLAGGASSIVVAMPAMAQDAADEEDRIVVTGSRISRQDYEANSPIVTVGADLLENSSTSSVEVNLNRLPQFVPEKNPTQGGDIQASPSNTPGSATISLRGIGSNRNLVLIDGRRATPSNASMAVDINTLPSAAIERVEIISGGASSTYGADAVGGVVNFILKKNFEGIEFNGQYGITQEGDGAEYNLSALMGTNFADGRGNISLAVSTSDRKPSYRRDRSWYQDLWANPDVGGNYFFPTFSGITQTGSNATYQNVLNSYFPNRTGNVSATGSLYFLPNGTPFTFGNSAAGVSGVSNFPTSLIDGQETVKSSLGGISQNFQEDYLNLPLTRYNFYMRGSYDINDWVSAIAQGYFNTSHTETVQQPGPIVGGWNVVIPRYQNDGTYLPAALSALLNARGTLIPVPVAPVRATGETDAAFATRVTAYNASVASYPTRVAAQPAALAAQGCGTVAGQVSAAGTFFSQANCPWSPTGYVPGLGNRETITDNYTYNMLFGLEGSIPGSDWSWDVTWQRGESITNFVTTGVASLERLRAVMSAPNFGAGFVRQGNAVGGGFGANRATCTSGLNPFSGAPVTADCIAAINADLKETATMRQTVWEANMEGSLFDLPAGEVRTALGATYRENGYVFREDTLKEVTSSFLDQALGIYPASSINEKLDSKEVYGEISIPLLHDMPLVQQLDLIAGIRYSDSSQTGGSTTWKVEGSWEVTDWLRFRGGYNRAERAPNIGELYSFTQNFGLLTGGDGCSVGNPFSYSANPANANGNRVRALCVQLMDKTQIPGQPLNSVSYYGNGLATTDPNYIAPSAGSTSTSTAPGFAFPYFVGNPNLTTETAKTITAGVVIDSPIESGAFSNLRLAVDYYNIKVNDAIGLQSGQTLQQLCLDPAFNPNFDPNSFFCENFQRGTGGGIGAVRLAYTNTAAFRTSGIDAQLDWRFDVGPGTFGLNSTFNYLMDLKSSPFYSGIPTASQTPFRDYAGTFAAPDAGLNTSGAYRWKVLTNFNYSLDQFRIGLQWQHLPSIKSGNTNTGYAAYDLFNLNSSYSATDAITLRFGVDNLFNTAPPFGNTNPLASAAAFQLSGGGYSSQNYDIVGRRFYVGANLAF